MIALPTFKAGASPAFPSPAAKAVTVPVFPKATPAPAPVLPYRGQAAGRLPVAPPPPIVQPKPAPKPPVVTPPPVKPAVIAAPVKVAVVSAPVKPAVIATPAKTAAPPTVPTAQKGTPQPVQAPAKTVAAGLTFSRVALYAVIGWIVYKFVIKRW